MMVLFLFDSAIICHFSNVFRAYGGGPRRCDLLSRTGRCFDAYFTLI